MRQVRRAFRIEAGVETELEIVLEPCVLREVHFTLPASTAKPKWIACSLHETDGKLVWGGNADCKLEPPVARVSAPPGSYRLMVGGEGGLVGEAELVLGPRGTGLPPLVLPLAR